MKFFIACLFLCTSIAVNSQSNLFLTYPQSAFDSDTCCWRKISSQGYYQEAGELILTYLQDSKAVTNHQALFWHAGQCFAMAGQDALAKKYMQKTYSSFYQWFGGEDGRTWYYYANGTVAFIDRDKKTLSAMIDKWEKRYPQNLNYQALRELQKHWELPYKEINKKI